MTKINSGVIFAVAILSVILCSVVRFPVFAQDSGSSKSKMTLLLEERRDTLKTRVEMIEKLVGIARSTPEELNAARDDLFNAEVEMATNHNERVAAFQRKLENAQQLEALMQQRKHEGRGTEAEVLMAKADRLGIEIELMREAEPDRKPE